MLTKSELTWAEQNLKGKTKEEVIKSYLPDVKSPMRLWVAYGMVNKPFINSLSHEHTSVIQHEIASRSDETAEGGQLDHSGNSNAPRANKQVSQNVRTYDPDAWIEVKEIEAEFNPLDEVEKEIKGRENSLRVKLNNIIKNAEGKMITIDEINRLCDEWKVKRSAAERRLRQSESLNIQAVMGPKKSGGETIIGYKWKL